jgi:hypothetical protein
MYIYDDDRFEKDLYEVINYLIEVDELEKEDIIGYKLDIAEKEQAIDEKTISKMEEILHNRCEERYDSGTYLEDRIQEIFDKLKTIEMYYPSGETYTITEEDYNDYFSV